jgi:hypothetical protein
MPEVTEPTTTEIIIMPEVEITSKIEIGNADLVNIAVARRERDLLAEETRLEKLSRDLSKVGSSLQKEFAKLCASTVTDHFIEDAKKLAAAYTVFGVTATPTVGFRSYDVEKNKLFASITVAELHTFTATVHSSMDATQEVTDLNEKMVANAAESAKCSEDRMSNKRELSRLATVERQARAAVAEAALNGSERGRKLLASIEGSIPNMPKLISKA